MTRAKKTAKKPSTSDVLLEPLSPRDAELARADVGVRERRNENARRRESELIERETLVSEYDKRLEVRQARDKIADAGRVPLAEQLKDQKLIPGRQTSPELAKLASRYLGVTPEWFMCEMAPGVAEEHAANVRKLAASVLSQVNE